MKSIFLISLFLIISNCSFNLVDDHHGVYYLEKKEKKIIVEKSNVNDILNVFGEPSTKSSFDNDVWIYIERKITNTHFFGRRKLITNNVLVLEIDERGILAKKDFYDINDMNNLKYLKAQTEKDFTNSGVLYGVFSSLREKINAPLKNKKIN